MEYKVNISKSTINDIMNHLTHCDDLFIPKLSSRIDLTEYSKKLFDKSKRFELWKNAQLIALIAVYLNKENKSIFISNVSVLRKHQGRGLARKIFTELFNYAVENNYNTIKLDVNHQNNPALSLYKSYGFVEFNKNNETISMIKNMNRDYNQEMKDTKDHKYAYNFDFDVMHPFMLKAFTPFFINGNLLELGSFKGDFTKRLIPHFNDITCVEASDEAINIAKQEIKENVNFINALFEDVQLTKKYDNIVLTHVLEHIDDPIKVLKRINDEWLSEKGRFFLVCPNANAPSRQIAVKMGLISHNSAVTNSEKEHGHHITYTLDTLERDAKAAGLKVIYRTGIFFKALANFQWDQLLQTDIISKEYLEGCYQLGQQYPDLCSSIFLLCEKGE